MNPCPQFAYLVNTLPTHRAWLYPLVIAGAMLVGVAISLANRRRAAVAGLPWRQRVGLLLGAFCGAMIGAKLPFVLSDWEGLRSGAAWFSDGKTILLGLVGGYFGVEIAKWVLDIRIKTGDSFAVPVAAAVAIGRLGCFCAGCCHGAVTHVPWAVVFPVVDSLPRHPTQLYEFAFHVTAAVGLYFCQRRGLFPGQLIKLYIIAYLAFRFLTEFIRPEARLFGPFTGYQLAAAVLVPVFVYLWIKDRKMMDRNMPEHQEALAAATDR